MADSNAAFVGSVPLNYDRYLGPLLFHQYADDLVARVTVKPGMRVLETACGTGIVTERLARRLAGQGTLVATDLNDPMIAYARSKGTVAPVVEWRQADATALPFEDASFDAVVSQFGLMFFPDKARGVHEAFRVLRPGGQYVFNVWDALAHNAVARITHETVATFFPSDPPQFYTVPFSLHDTTQVSAWLAAAGFEHVEPVSVAKVGTSLSAADAAIGLIEGNPIAAAIAERRAAAVPEVKAAVARNLTTELGDDRPLRCALRAFVFSARRPGSPAPTAGLSASCWPSRP
jgi:ubiquinone/menaquinone biosynthesis C-methylase UbiE